MRARVTRHTLNSRRALKQAGPEHSEGEPQCAWVVKVTPGTAHDGWQMYTRIRDPIVISGQVRPMTDHPSGPTGGRRLPVAGHATLVSYWGTQKRGRWAAVAIVVGAWSVTADGIALDAAGRLTVSRLSGFHRAIGARQPGLLQPWGPRALPG